MVSNTCVKKADLDKLALIHRKSYIKYIFELNLTPSLSERFIQDISSYDFKKEDFSLEIIYLHFPAVLPFPLYSLLRRKNIHFVRDILFLTDFRSIKGFGYGYFEMLLNFLYWLEYTDDTIPFLSTFVGNHSKEEYFYLLKSNKAGI